MDEAGIDTVWLAEAYPWWRKHGMEAKSSTVLAGMIARETKRLAVGWGIISPYTRHPVQVAMDARIVQEAAGPGRFIAGFGTSKIFLNSTKQGGPPQGDAAARAHARLGRDHARHPRRRALRVRRQGLLGRHPGARAGGPRAALERARSTSPAPRRCMQQLGGEIGDGLLTPSITTPDFVRYTLGNVEDRRREGRTRPGLGRRRLHDRRLDPRHRSRQGPRRRARDRGHVPRQQGAEHPGLGRHAARPRADRPRGDPARRRGDGAAAAAWPPRPRSPTRSSTAASPSPARPTTAWRRSRSIAPRGARTSCSSSGARPARADQALRREGPPARARERVSEIRIDRDRLVGVGGPRDRHAELHRRRAGDGRAHARDVHGDGPERAVAAGRGRPRERARDPRGCGRRHQPDVQRAHGHLVLGPRAVADRGARVPAGALRRGRQPLRPRHLEHEGRPRVLRRGPARARTTRACACAATA